MHRSNIRKDIIHQLIRRKHKVQQKQHSATTDLERRRTSEFHNRQKQPGHPCPGTQFQLKQSKQAQKNYLEWPDVGTIDSSKSLLDVEKPSLVLPEVNRVVSLEIHLDEDQSLVVLALYRLEEASLA